MLKSPVGLLFYGLFCLLIAGLFGQDQRERWRLAEETTSWRPTTAEVRSARVRHRRRRGQVANIEYAYTVDGRTYVSSRVAAQNLTAGQRGVARELVRTFRRGARVTAYVNPRDPAEAVLITGGSPALLTTGVLLTSVFGLGGVILLVEAWRASRSGLA